MSEFMIAHSEGRSLARDVNTGVDKVWWTDRLDYELEDSDEK